MSAQQIRERMAARMSERRAARATARTENSSMSGDARVSSPVVLLSMRESMRHRHRDGASDLNAACRDLTRRKLHYREGRFYINNKRPKQKPRYKNVRRGRARA